MKEKDKNFNDKIKRAPDSEHIVTSDADLTDDVDQPKQEDGSKSCNIQ